LNAGGNLAIEEEIAMNREATDSRKKLVASRSHPGHIRELTDGEANISDHFFSRVDCSGVSRDKSPDLIQLPSALPRNPRMTHCSPIFVAAGCQNFLPGGTNASLDSVIEVFQFAAVGLLHAFGNHLAKVGKGRAILFVQLFEKLKTLLDDLIGIPISAGLHLFAYERGQFRV
jgi:hypothetical protein